MCAGFSFPLFLTTAHMVFSFVALLPIMMAAPFRKLHRGVLTKQWKGLACVGACDPAFRASCSQRQRTHCLVSCRVARAGSWL